MSEKFILRTIDYPTVFTNASTHIRTKHAVPEYNTILDIFCEEFSVSLVIDKLNCDVIFESEAQALFFILRWS